MLPLGSSWTADRLRDGFPSSNTQLPHAGSLRRCTREDEYSFVLEGAWGFQLGNEVVYAEPGDLVYKPRDVWHTFWNASDELARLLEIISPSGFEQFFVELAALLPMGIAVLPRSTQPDDALDAIEVEGRRGMRAGR